MKSCFGALVLGWLCVVVCVGACVVLCDAEVCLGFFSVFSFDRWFGFFDRCNHS